SYFLDRNTNLAEIAFTVRKDYRNQGLTKYMVNRLIEIAQEKRIAGFIGEILSTNGPMIHVIKNLPYKVQFHNYGDTFEFSFRFDEKKTIELKKEEEKKD
ncbi:MAG: GNAT family N-acetyltransferase, partial [Promethearchaeota archaeon]